MEPVMFGDSDKMCGEGAGHQPVRQVIKYCVCVCIYVCMYIVGSKSFQPDIQKPRQMENAVRDM